MPWNFKQTKIPSLLLSSVHVFLIMNFLSGATGLGKSTMVNTLFKGRLSRMSSTGAAAAIPKTVEVKSVSHGMANNNQILLMDGRDANL